MSVVDDETSTVTSLLQVSHDADNLFVQLTPGILAMLSAACNFDVITDREIRSDGLSVSWNLKDDHSKSFLPLEIFLPDQILYASFNGGILEEMEETIQIPDGLLTNKSIDLHHVRVRALPSVKFATRVHVDPVTFQDWELLRVHADRLEEGWLLKCVTFIYKQQCLKLIVPALTGLMQMKDIIHVVVTDLSFSNCEDVLSPWPVSEELRSRADDTNDSENYALLRADTEVIINPKSRSRNDMISPYQWSKALKLIPSAEDIGSDVVSSLRETIQDINPIQDVMVGCISLNSKDFQLGILNDEIQWVEIQLEGCQERAGNGTIARVVLSDTIPESCAVLHPWIRWELGATLLWNQVVVRLHSTPTSIAPEMVTLKPVSLSEASNQLRAWRDWEHRPRLGCHNIPNGAIIPVGSYVAQPNASGQQLFRLIEKNPEKGDRRAYTVFESEGHLAEISRLCHSVDDEELVLPWQDKLLLSALQLPILQSTTGVATKLLKSIQKHPRSLCILHGPSGTGLTHSASFLASLAAIDHGRALVYLNCKHLKQLTKTLSEILSEIDDAFKRATTVEPSLIVLDNLDQIAPNLIGGDEGDPGSRTMGVNPAALSQSKVIADRIAQCYAGSAGGTVSIVATCRGQTTLHRSLVAVGVLLGMGMPSRDDRFCLFSHFLGNGLPCDIGSVHPSKSAFQRRTEGFRPRDLEKLAARSRRGILRLDDGLCTNASVTVNSVQAAISESLQSFVPLSHIGLDRRSLASGLSWSEIGGLFTAKNALESTILKPIKYRAIYEQAKIRLPRGILLFGPTGCGKSCIVPALAKACNFPLISCKGPEVLDKYIGASEAKIRELFQRAAAVAPSILFLDEMEALAARRGSDHTGVTDRVVNQLLTFLDGVEDTPGATVYVIGASSRPDKIDPALLRPGRLEQHLFIGPPEIDLEWLDLISKISLNWRLSIACREYITSETGRSEILEKLKVPRNICPADLKAAMDTAQLNAVHRTLKDRNPVDVEYVEIESDDIMSAFSSLRPCLSPADAQSLEGVYDRFRPRRNSKGSATIANQAESLRTTLR